MKVLVLAIISIGLSSCSLAPAPPSDEQMIHAFGAHRDVFERLVKMACKDHYTVVSMDPEWSRPANIPSSTRQQYYKLFKTVGVKQLQSYGGCRAQLSVWSVGLGGDGDYKDYQYRPERVENPVASLDNLELGDKIVFYYRKIAPNWYIRYAHWP